MTSKPAKLKPRAAAHGLTFQDLLFTLEKYWTEKGCILQQPYDMEVGAGTMHPETFLRVLGPQPYRVVYAQPSRRPSDGRYGENPNRLFKHTQLQVILKPAPVDVQDLYLESLRAIGINLKQHDVRFEEDNWEAPTLGAWGVGWQVLLDGLEITQFTYFQQCGGIDLDPVPVELTYGLDRIAAYLQDVDNVFDVRWSADVTYRQVRLPDEQQFSAYNFDWADPVGTRKMFDLAEAEAQRLLKAYAGLAIDAKKRFPILAAYEMCLKCSHLFNVLDARGVISTTERAAIIGRVRQIACKVAAGWLEQQTASEAVRAGAGE
ncbi:MAG: glycine--tRNA ligase subunit alpha [Candidatus Acidiferrales bacterium]